MTKKLRVSTIIDERGVYQYLTPEHEQSKFRVLIESNVKSDLTSSTFEPTTFVVKSGSYALAMNGITDDRSAFNTLVNTTIPGGGGVVTLVTGSLFLSSSMTIPASVTIDAQQGGMFKLAAGVTLIVCGSIKAGPYKIFDNVNAINNFVRFPRGAVVYPEWWGAKSDSGITDCYVPFSASIQSLQGSTSLSRGGKVKLTATSGYYGISSHLYFRQASGAFFDNIVIEGEGWGSWIKHTQLNTPITNPGALGLITILSGPAYLNDLTFKNFKISGYSPSDYNKIIYVGNAQNVTFDNVWQTDNAIEGFCTPGAVRSHGRMLNCRADRVGVDYLLSAYNANINDALIDGCTAYDCGFGIEHTGRGLIATNNKFYRTLHIAMAICSTVWSNGHVICSNNLIDGCVGGISVADGVRTLGSILISDNVIRNAESGIITSGKAAVSGTLVAKDNYLLGGGSNGTAIIVNTPGAIVEGNVIDQIYGATTLGSITSGSATLSVTGGSTGVDIAKNYTLTIAGVAGTYTVLSSSQTTDDALQVLTLNAPSPTTVASATVTYASGPWAYGINQVADVHCVIKNNTLRGIPWTTRGIRLTSPKAIVEDNIFDGKGRDISGQQWLGMGDGSVQQITNLNIDPMAPFKYSISRRSECTAPGIPAKLTWKPGDIIWNKNAGSGSANLAWFNTGYGTNGTLTNVTGSIDAGTKLLKVNDNTGLHVHSSVTIAGVTGAKKLMSYEGGLVYMIDTNADATVTGSMQYNAASFVPIGFKQAASVPVFSGSIVSELVAELNLLRTQLRNAGIVA